MMRIRIRENDYPAFGATLPELLDSGSNQLYTDLKRLNDSLTNPIALFRETKQPRNGRSGVHGAHRHLFEDTLLDALSPGNPWNRDIARIFAAVTGPMTTVVRRHDEGEIAGAIRALRETEQLVDRGIGG